MEKQKRLSPGKPAPFFSVESLSHGRVSLPAPQIVHLQFRRFAGCPICNLHMRKFSQRAAEFSEQEVTLMAVFHSPLDELRPFHAELPYVVIGDPGFELYKKYGVGRSIASVLHPRALGAGVVGLVAAKSSPFGASGGHLGLVADFLIDASGFIIDAKYGKHADDHWEVDEVLHRVKLHRSSALAMTS